MLPHDDGDPGQRRVQSHPIRSIRRNICHAAALVPSSSDERCRDLSQTATQPRSSTSLTATAEPSTAVPAGWIAGARAGRCGESSIARVSRRCAHASPAPRMPWRRLVHVHDIACPLPRAPSLSRSVVACQALGAESHARACTCIPIGLVRYRVSPIRSIGASCAGSGLPSGMVKRYYLASWSCTHCSKAE